jgi:hypothetical protein
MAWLQAGLVGTPWLDTTGADMWTILKDQKKSRVWVRFVLSARDTFVNLVNFTLASIAKVSIGRLRPPLIVANWLRTALLCHSAALVTLPMKGPLQTLAEVGTCF